MKQRGRGVACGWYGIARTAAMDRAAVWVELDDGGGCFGKGTCYCLVIDCLGT